MCNSVLRGELCKRHTVQITVQDGVKDWEERFDKLKNVFDWIKINCKDEIISGIDINHIDDFLRSFISSVREEVRRGVFNELKGWVKANPKITGIGLLNIVNPTNNTKE